MIKVGIATIGSGGSYRIELGPDDPWARYTINFQTPYQMIVGLPREDGEELLASWMAWQLNPQSETSVEFFESDQYAS